MATVADITTIARNYLRDFPKFFQLSYSISGRTYDLSKPNIDPASLWVAFVPTGASAGTVIPSTEYSLDSRNGMLRLATAVVGESILVEGYNYEWLTESDLTFYSEMAINSITHNIDVSLSNLAPAVSDTIGVGALVQALWGLLSQFSRDIDVITSESVHIVASQRYRMVSDLLDHWVAEYNTRAQALNIGLDKIEVLNLRRVSKTTNRLIPIYKEREVGDYGPIKRIWPGIGDGEIHLTDESDELRTDVMVEGEPPPGQLSTGYY